MKKLSFSVAASKSSSKTNKKVTSDFTDAAQDDSESNRISKQFVTEFDGTKTLAQIDREKRVIPRLENEVWKPHKKMKNLELPLDAAGKHNSLDFELEVPVAESDDKVSYGLTLREGRGSGSVKVQDVETGGAERVNSRSTENMLLEKLRYDLQRLPEHKGFAEFEDTPVEGYGAALLAGYGWVEGKGIGKNAKEDVKVKTYTKRTAKEGLGFYDDKYAEARKEAKNVKVAGKETVTEDVVVEEKNKFAVGDEVRVVAGRKNVGSKGSVVEMNERDKLVLKHSITSEEFEVRVSDVALLGSKEEEECLRKLKEPSIKASKEDGRKVKEQQMKEKRHKSSKSSSNKEDGRSGTSRKEDRKPQIKWLTNNIKVRVVSKDIKRGRLYCKKGKVIDVVGPLTCDLRMDDNNELVQGLDQELLETAIPRPGGRVLVLYGEHKGVYGTLMERDRESETGIVRDEDTHSLITVGFEQIAEYVGDPAELGY